MALQVGDALGVYEIQDVIGAGGMATVYQAHQSKLGRDVAVKVMHDVFAANDEFRTRFEREARIVARLDHPNIVPVYDFDENDNQPYLVMKFVEGITLKDLMDRGELSPEEILSILEPVAKALHYAHEQGVLHRDVKPSNILMDRRGHAYLTDFGLARIAQAGESTMSMESMLGTPHYISPEQANGVAELDGRADVYSLGVVLYRLVTGDVPFTSDSSYGLIYHHIHTPPPAPREMKPDIDPQVEVVLLKALEKNPDLRYSTPVELMNDFRAALKLQPANDSFVQPQISTAPPPPRAPKPPKVPEEEKSTFSGIMESFGAGLVDVGREIKSSIEDEIRKEVNNRKMSEEERIRQQVEERLKKRQEEQQGLIIHLVIYFFVNGVILGWNPWVAFFWGIGLVSHFADYWNKHGPGRARQERAIEREVARERERMYGNSVVEKSKRRGKDSESDYGERRVRLTEDGEFTDSFIDELEQDDKRKRR